MCLSLAEEQALAEADMAEDIFGKAEAESWLEEVQAVLQCKPCFSVTRASVQPVL